MQFRLTEREAVTANNQARKQGIARIVGFQIERRNAAADVNGRERDRGRVDTHHLLRAISRWIVVDDNACGFHGHHPRHHHAQSSHAQAELSGNIHADLTTQKGEHVHPNVEGA